MMPHPTTQGHDWLPAADASSGAALARLLSPLFLAGTTLLLGSPASALVTNFSGDTTGKNTWSRPEADGTNPPTIIAPNATATPYQSFSFTVPTSGNYTIETSTFAASPTWDSYLFLYQDNFDPLAPLQGVLVGNDDFGSSKHSSVTQSLSTTVTYYIVQTGYASDDFGSFTGTIDGPGLANIGGSPASVPGPLPLFGAAAAFGYSRKLRKSVKSSELPAASPDSRRRPR
jgi:hypothetical protein